MWLPALRVACTTTSKSNMRVEPLFLASNSETVLTVLSKR